MLGTLGVPVTAGFAWCRQRQMPPALFGTHFAGSGRGATCTVSTIMYGKRLSIRPPEGGSCVRHAVPDCQAVAPARTAAVRLRAARLKGDCAAQRLVLKSINTYRCDASPPPS
jgi:hypothetical protein